MRCANCGTENSDVNRFCVNCGMPLAAAAPPQPETYSEPEPAPYTPAYPEPETYSVPEPAPYTPAYSDPEPYAQPEPAPYEGPVYSPPAAPEEPDIGFRPMPPDSTVGGGTQVGRGGTGGGRKKKTRAGSAGPGPGVRPKQPARGGRSNLALLIVIGVFALALIGGGLYYFLGRGTRPAQGGTPAPVALQTPAPTAEAAAGSPEPSAAAPETTPPAAETAAPAPGERLTPEQLEDAVLRIREKYNDIMSRVDAGTYTTTMDTADGMTRYFDIDDIKCIMVPGGTNGSTYTRWFYFDQGRLFFAYYEGADAHRLYFQDDVMIRWRYCVDKDQPDNAENYDQLDTEAYRAKQDQVLEEAYRFSPEGRP